MKSILIVMFALSLVLPGCEKQAQTSVDSHGFSAPTKQTSAVNAAVEKELPLDDQQDVEDARRGLIASDGQLKVVGPGMGTIWDQTVRMANAGLTPREISEELDFPESMRTTFANRGYYGTLSHNAKAVYQFYFGWYDANPANLNPLPPAASGKRYVEFMGGVDSVLTKAKDSFDKGEYRWAAEVLSHLVFAEPGNDKARELLATTYDQLGYQAESGPWRDVYLTGAYELRHGGPEKGLHISNAMELLEQTPISNFLDAMSVRLNGPKADGKNLKINLVFTDIGESYVLHIENAVLHHKMAPPDVGATATLNITHPMFLRMATNTAGIKEFLLSDDIELEGSKLDMVRFFALLDRPKGTFNIVIP